MEKQEYVHYNIKGLIALDMIACTQETTRRTTLEHTDILDKVTCPACVSAVNQDAAQHRQRQERMQSRKRAGDQLAALLQKPAVVHFDFPDLPAICNGRRSKRLTQVIDDVTCVYCVRLLVRRAYRQVRESAR